jgi:acyl-CoA synthetase (AMP-forming)/AMP-acid ligase II
VFIVKNLEHFRLQVSPSELESILVVHPAIQDAAVVGIEDETYGELPGAFIVREPETRITEDEIKGYVARKYSYFMNMSFFHYFHSIFKRKLLSANIKLKLHKNLIRSVMIYACPAWEFPSENHLLKLQCLQNKALRTTWRFPAAHIGLRYACGFPNSVCL